MRLATRAWQLRQASRGALATGDIEIAIEFAEQAEALQSTSAGAALRTMCAWLRRDTADAQHG